MAEHGIKLSELIEKYGGVQTWKSGVTRPLKYINTAESSEQEPEQSGWFGNLLLDSLKFGGQTALGLIPQEILPDGVSGLAGGTLAEMLGNGLQAMGDPDRTLAARYNPALASVLRSIGGTAQDIGDSALEYGLSQVKPRNNDEYLGSLRNQFDSGFYGVLQGDASMVKADKSVSAFEEAIRRLADENAIAPSRSWEYILSPHGLTRSFGNVAGSMGAILPSMALAPESAFLTPANAITRFLINRGAYGLAKRTAGNLPNYLRYAATSAPAEALSEGGHVRTENLAQGVNDEEATRRGWNTAAANLPILLGSNLVEAGLFGTPFSQGSALSKLAQAGLRTGGNALQQGTEEALQKAVSNAQTGKEYGLTPFGWTPDQWQDFAEGFAGTLPMGIVGSGAHAISDFRRPAETDEERANREAYEQGSDENISIGDFSTRAEKQGKQHQHENLRAWADKESGGQMSDEVFNSIVRNAQAYGIPVKRALAVAIAESNGNQDEVSPAGAIGVMQLIPSTAQGLGVDPYDTEQNIRGGMKYLRQMYDQYGDWNLAHAAYNAGPGNVTDHVPQNGETEKYVDKINEINGLLSESPSYYKDTDSPSNDSTYLGNNGKGEGRYWVRQGDHVSFDGAQPDLLNAVDILGKMFYDRTGKQLVITAGTNGDHAGGEHSHGAGWKVDIVDAGANGVGMNEDGALFTADYRAQPFLKEFIAFGRSLGLGMNLEAEGTPNVHIDVALDGHQWDGNGEDAGGFSLDRVRKNARGTAQSSEDISTPSRTQETPQTPPAKEEPPKPLFDLNDPKLFEEFANEKRTSSTDMEAAEAENFFAPMFTDKGKFKNTKTNRQAIRDRYGDDFTDWVNARRQNTQPPVQPPQPAPPTTQETPVETQENTLPIQTQGQPQTPPQTAPAPSVENQPVHPEPQPIQPPQSLIQDTQTPQPTQKAENVVQNNQPPENILSSSEFGADENLAAQEIAKNDGLPGVPEARMQQAKALMRVANFNHVQLPEPLKIALRRGDTKGIIAAQNILREKGLIPAQPQPQQSETPAQPTPQQQAQQTENSTPSTLTGAFLNGSKSQLAEVDNLSQQDLVRAAATNEPIEIQTDNGVISISQNTGRYNDGLGVLYTVDYMPDETSVETSKEIADAIKKEASRLGLEIVTAEDDSEGVQLTLRTPVIDLSQSRLKQEFDDYDKLSTKEKVQRKQQVQQAAFESAKSAAKGLKAVIDALATNKQSPVQESPTPQSQQEQSVQKTNEEKSHIIRVNKATHPGNMGETERKRTGNSILWLANKNGVAIPDEDAAALKNGSPNAISSWREQVLVPKPQQTETQESPTPQQQPPRQNNEYTSESPAHAKLKEAGLENKFAPEAEQRTITIDKFGGVRINNPSNKVETDLRNLADQFKGSYFTAEKELYGDRPSYIKFGFANNTDKDTFIKAANIYLGNSVDDNEQSTDEAQHQTPDEKRRADLIRRIQEDETAKTAVDSFNNGDIINMDAIDRDLADPNSELSRLMDEYDFKYDKHGNLVEARPKKKKESSEQATTQKEGTSEALSRVVEHVKEDVKKNPPRTATKYTGVSNDDARFSATVYYHPDGDEGAMESESADFLNLQDAIDFVTADFIDDQPIHGVYYNSAEIKDSNGNVIFDSMKQSSPTIDELKERIAEYDNPAKQKNISERKTPTPPDTVKGKTDEPRKEQDNNNTREADEHDKSRVGTRADGGAVANREGTGEGVREEGRTESSGGNVERPRQETGRHSEDDTESNAENARPIREESAGNASTRTGGRTDKRGTEGTVRLDENEHGEEKETPTADVEKRATAALKEAGLEKDGAFESRGISIEIQPVSESKISNGKIYSQVSINIGNLRGLTSHDVDNYKNIAEKLGAQPDENNYTKFTIEREDAPVLKRAFEKYLERSTDKRIEVAFDQIKKENNFSDEQTKWLDQIEEYMHARKAYGEITREDFDRDRTEFKKQGGFEKINEIFDGKLSDIINDINGKVRGEKQKVSKKDDKPHEAKEDKETLNVTRNNFHITEDSGIGEGGLKTKFKQNIEAIKLLKQIESEGRMATPDEQSILAKFNGWGTLASAFSNSKGWEKETAELRELLTEDEYQSAIQATPNAFYTSPEIAKAMWEGVTRLGFKGGRVLDPSTGSGIFFGTMPVELTSNSALVGVELDDLTGRIAKQLYQKADIEITGFQSRVLPDNYFDLAISNVPFSDMRIKEDPAYRKHNFALHNYFFAKAIDKVRPGGLMVFITSTGTLQTSSNLHEYLDQRADLIAAYKLPSNAFDKNAGTKVTTDIVIFQKRLNPEFPSEHAQDWSTISNKYLDIERADGTKGYGYADVNTYFMSHPDHMIGEPIFDTLYANSHRLALDGTGRDVIKELGELMNKLPENISPPINRTKAPAETKIILTNSAKNVDGTFAAHDGKIYQQRGGKLIEITGKEADAARDYIHLLGTLDALLKAQRDQNATDEKISNLRKILNQRYDDFVKKYGYLNSAKNSRLFAEDPNYGHLAAIEDYTETKKGNKIINVTAGKTAIFSKRTIEPNPIPTSADTPTDALTISLSMRGRVDMDYMSDLTGKSVSELEHTLGDSLYKNPETNQYELAEEYLSGNVREKLAQAKEAARTNPEFKRNVTALEKVQPHDIDENGIAIKLGATWIEQKYYEDFVRDLLDLAKSADVNIKYSPSAKMWTAHVNPGWQSGNEFYKWTVRSQHGRSSRGFEELLEAAMNHKYPTLTYSVGKEKYVDEVATAEAREKVKQIKEYFATWVWEDAERKSELLKAYNAMFNSNVLRNYDGSNFTLHSDLVEDVKNRLYPHQKDAIWRILQGKNVLLAHCVGAGKTWTMQIAAMEMKRLGIIKKPMFVVPNSITGQFEKEFRVAYPGAKLLTLTSKNLPEVKDNPENRAERTKILSKIAVGDWDGIIISHDIFQRLPISPEAESEFIREEINLLEAEQRARAKDSDSAKFVKQLGTAISKLKDKLEADKETRRREICIPFDELGVDQIFVDEADCFKNLHFNSQLIKTRRSPGDVKVVGVSNPDANRSRDMYMKTRILSKMRNGGGVVFATGTPVSNTLCEIYTMMRYLVLPELEDKKMSAFDAWAHNFVKPVDTIQLAPSGKGFETVQRINLTNLGVLINEYRSIADIKMAEDIPQLKRPKLKGGKRTVVEVKTPEAYKKFLDEVQERAEAIHNGLDPSVDNMLKVTGDLKQASLDMRLIDPSLSEAEGGTKVVAACDTIAAKYKETADVKGTQVIFLDLSVPKNKEADSSDETDEQSAPDEKISEAEASTYKRIKDGLIKRGIPADEIAFVHEAKNPKQRDKLFARVNNGEIRVIIGSTGKMGAGVNFQKHLVALHHLDCPWRPRDVEQREGRILRSGNDNAEVEIFTYVTKDSYDANTWEKVMLKKEMMDAFLRGDETTEEIEDFESNDTMSYEDIMNHGISGEERKTAGLNSKLRTLQYEKSVFQKGKLEKGRQKGRLLQVIPQLEQRLKTLRSDIASKIDTKGDTFKMKIGDTEYTKRADAGKALEELIKNFEKETFTKVGEIGGFDLKLRAEHTFASRGGAVEVVSTVIHAQLANNGVYSVDPSLKSIEHFISNGIDKELANAEKKLKVNKAQLEAVEGELSKPFSKQTELTEVESQLKDLRVQLGGRDDSEFALNTEQPETQEENNQQESIPASEETETETKPTGEVTKSSPEEDWFKEHVIFARADDSTTQQKTTSASSDTPTSESVKAMQSALREQSEKLINDAAKDPDTARALKQLGATVKNGKVTYPDDETFQACINLAEALKNGKILVWHGTPVTFDKFSLLKVASNKVGGIAHGWGLYFAENEDASLDWLGTDRLKGEAHVTINGKKIILTFDGKQYSPSSVKDSDGVPITDRAELLLLNYITDEIFSQYDIKRFNKSRETGWDVSGKPFQGVPVSETDVMDAFHPLDEMRNALERLKERRVDVSNEYRQELEDDISKTEAEITAYNLASKTTVDNIQVKNTGTGKLFRVAIPNTDVMLTAEKKLADHSLGVRKAIKEIYKEKGLKLDDKLNGEDIYWEIVESFLPAGQELVVDTPYGKAPNDTHESKELVEAAKKASMLLSQKGVKGLAHYDTTFGKNYVMYDDSVIDVVKRFSLHGNGDTTIANFVDTKDLTPQPKLLQSFGKKLGVFTVFFNNENEDFHGAHSKGVTFLNVNSKKSLSEVFWHETLHWLKNNNPELYKALVKAAGITDAQRRAYLETSKRTDLKSNDEIDEEILADMMGDVAKRTGLFQSIAGKNRGLIERVIQWFKDTLNKFIDHFRNPQGKLTTAQAQALANEFGRIANQLKDPNGNQIFRYNRRAHNVELADNRERTEAEIAEMTAKNAHFEAKYSVDSNDNKPSFFSRAWNKFAKAAGLDGDRIVTEEDRRRAHLQAQEKAMAAYLKEPTKDNMHALKQLGVTKGQLDAYMNGEEYAPEIGLIQNYRGSPSRIADKNAVFRAFFNMGDRAMDKLVKLRDSFANHYGEAMALVKNKDDREQLIQLLWDGDEEQKEFTKEELLQDGVKENVADAYLAIRRLMRRAYIMLDEARRRPQSYAKYLTNAEYERLRDNKFVKQGTLKVHDKQDDKGNHLVTWTEYANQERTYKIDGSARARFLADDAIQILEEKQLPDGTYEVTVREGIPKLTDREGYIPHFFHEYTARVRDADGKQVGAIIGTGRTQREAIKLAEEWQKNNTLKDGEQIYIQPHTFNFGMDENYAPIMGDKDYAVMMSRIAKNTGTTLAEAQQIVKGAVKLKNRHRFLGQLLKRKGYAGYEKDMDWVLRHHFNTVARYVALETEFKPKAISLFERVFGAFDKDHSKNLLAKYTKDYINDVNGVPAWIDEVVNKTLNQNSVWRKYFMPNIGERGFQRIGDSIASINAYLKLGMFNISSAMINFTQLINAAGYVGWAPLMKHFGQVVSRKGNLTLGEMRILNGSGVLQDIGLDTAGGYDKNRGYGSDLSGLKWLDWLGKKSMIPFQKCDMICRISTALAAYDKAVAEGKSRAEALAYAKKVNRDANFSYGIEDAPNLMRRTSTFGKVALQFYKYPLKQFEVLADFLPLPQNKKTTWEQKAAFWLPYFLACGLTGIIPFFDWGDDWLNKHFGLFPKDFMQRTIMELSNGSEIKRMIAKVIMYGAPALANIDVSKRTGMASLTTPNSIFGAAGGTVWGVGSNLVQGNFPNALRSFSPGLFNIYMAAVGGETHNARGRKLSSYEDAYARLIRGLGFTSVDESVERDIERIAYNAKSERTKLEQRAIDAYIADETPENRRRLEGLGISAKRVKDERRKKKLGILERRQENIPKKRRRDYEELFKFAR